MTKPLTYTIYRTGGYLILEGTNVRLYEDDLAALTEALLDPRVIAMLEDGDE